MHNNSELFDLTNPNHHDRVRHMAEDLMRDASNYTDIAHPDSVYVFEQKQDTL